MIHSPFHIIPEFFSPSVCEQLIQEFGVAVPTYEVDDETPIPNERLLIGTRFHNLVKTGLESHADAIESRYKGVVAGMNEPRFLQYFEDPKHPCVQHGCENSKFVKKKWVKIKDVDLVAYIFLKDFNNSVPLDPSFEVYGGKLEFPAYDFSLTPVRGTCVIFPAGPHFITAVSHVFAGTNEYIKVGLKLVIDSETEEPIGWYYQPDQFPGTYQEWFSQTR